MLFRSVYDEKIDITKPYELFDPDFTWKRKVMDNYILREMHVPIFEKGVCVYENPTIEEIRDYCKKELESMWDEVLRFENPHNYYVDLSQKLWDEKHKLLRQGRK